ncbi:M23 family metallopeptidase [Streptomyces violaceorubidus]|uniref:M23 family metallopeptidase n=1 Tax=Streptomyces violaceorubidus TaxID=284042 RepID=UPI000B1C4419|nr:M23 family metallopeptidase [Streptomyces violaceorubidus]
MADYLAKIPGKMIGGLKDKIVSAATSFFGGRDGAPRVGSGDWALPVLAAVGTRFGVPGSMWSSGYHTGLDFPAATGTPVKAIDDGRVTYAKSGGPYGNHILIDHGRGPASMYAHLSRMTAKTGQDVIRGQGIGKVGATGNTTGPHLHLEARRNGATVDPFPLLFDNGGFLPPGLSLVSNQTREPEPILTSDQWGMIRKLYGQAGDAQSHQLTSQQLADISAAKGGGASPVYNEVRVFMGDREITDVVRTEINTYDREAARSLDIGRWV